MFKIIGETNSIELSRGRSSDEDPEHFVVSMRAYDRKIKGFDVPGVGSPAYDDDATPPWDEEDPWSFVEWRGSPPPERKSGRFTGGDAERKGCPDIKAI